MHVVGCHSRPKAKGCITNTSTNVCSNYFISCYHGNHKLLRVLDMQKHGFHGNGITCTQLLLTFWYVPERSQKKLSKVPVRLVLQILVYLSTFHLYLASTWKINQDAWYVGILLDEISSCNIRNARYFVRAWKVFLMGKSLNLPCSFFH